MEGFNSVKFHKCCWIMIVLLQLLLSSTIAIDMIDYWLISEERVASIIYQHQ